MLLGVGALFVVVSLLMLPSAPRVAIPNTAFFGACFVVFAANVLRKRRFAAMRLREVEIAGETPIRPSRAYVAVLGGGLFFVGVVLLVFEWPAAPLVVRLSILAIAAAGAALLALLAAGRLPAGYLQFDPAGLTVGQRGFTMHLPWDQIGTVTAGEMHHNPVLLLSMASVEAVVVEPAAERPRALRQIARSAQWTGAHVVVMTAQYRIDLPLLVALVERYVSDPAARARLGVPRLPGS